MSQRFDVPLSDAIAEASVLWMVRLHSGDVSEQERHAFEAWLEQDHQRTFGHPYKSKGYEWGVGFVR